MSGDILFVYGLLFVTIALFVSDKIRLDVTAVLVMVALTLSGILPVKDVVSGFGSTLIMLIAGLFVIGEGLFRTGVAAQIGHVIARFAGNSEIRLLAIIMPAVAGLSAFMSSTGAVAIFIPIVISLSREAGISQSRVLMPIAFAGLIGGMLTPDRHAAPTSRSAHNWNAAGLPLSTFLILHPSVLPSWSLPWFIFY